MVSLNSSAGLALGIDFGHRHLRVAVSDLSHTVLAETWREIDVDHSADEGLDAAAEFVDQVLDEAGRRPQPGDRGRDGPARRRSTAPPAPSRPPRSSPAGSGSTPPPRRARGSGCRSRSRTTPTSARSPSSSGAPARGKSEVAYIKVSSGIGAGLISGGRLQHGVGGTAGEIGHTVIAEGGPVCRCGNRGCLETLASTRAIAELLCESRASEISTRRLLELSEAGDAAAAAADRRRRAGDRDRGREPLQPAQPAVRDRRRRPVSVAGEILLEPMREVGAPQRDPERRDDLEIVAGVLGERAELLGALALVMQESDRFAAPELLSGRHELEINRNQRAYTEHERGSKRVQT